MENILTRSETNTGDINRQFARLQEIVNVWYAQHHSGGALHSNKFFALLPLVVLPP